MQIQFARHPELENHGTISVDCNPKRFDETEFEQWGVENHGTINVDSNQTLTEMADKLLSNQHAGADEEIPQPSNGEIEWFKKALSQMQSLPDSHDKVFGLLKLGYLAIERDQMKREAYQILQDA
ncbi:MAG: hypothetical protein DRR19_17540 [Candidatus Parabeggiatoa sp. nov. 1]|nr:MAG: hypothetical protein DRR19_17540 [Gammaproteobacteria bacterium]